jgi:hypothetical protein
MEHNHFLSVVAHAWSIPTPHLDPARKLTAKFKTLRRVLRAWQAQLSNLNTNIANVKMILSLLELMEKFRDLTVEEWNFKDVLS